MYTNCLRFEVAVYRYSVNTDERGIIFIYSNGAELRVVNVFV